MNTTGKFKYTVKARVTEQLVKLELDTEYFVRFDFEIYKAKENAARRKAPDDKPAQEPPHLCKITLLDDMSQGVMIIPTVLKTELEDAYPAADYVGRCFRLVRHRLEGRRYNTFEISEIEVEGLPEITEHKVMRMEHEHTDPETPTDAETPDSAGASEGEPKRKRK